MNVNITGNLDDKLCVYKGKKRISCLRVCFFCFFFLMIILKLPSLIFLPLQTTFFVYFTFLLLPLFLLCCVKKKNTLCQTFLVAKENKSTVKFLSKYPLHPACVLSRRTLNKKAILGNVLFSSSSSPCNLFLS